MVEKEFESADKVFVPIFNLSDFYLLEYAKRLSITIILRSLFWMLQDRSEIILK
jgi:hypothetical protein